MSPRLNDLTGVVLSATLDGKDKPPSQQPGLIEYDILEKEASIHDSAINTVKNIWTSKSFDGFAVTPVPISCSGTAKSRHRSRMSWPHSVQLVCRL